MALISFDAARFCELSVASDLTLNWTTMDQFGASDILQADTALDLNAWYYVVATYEAGTGNKSLYLNGDLSVQTQVSGGGRLGNSNVSRQALVASGFNANGAFPTRCFTGEIAQVRIYNKAISPEKIQQDQTAGLVSSAAYLKYYPIEFDLRDADDANVIFIYDEPEGHTLKVEVKNVSSQGIGLTPIATPDSGHYHFALTFRPGTLSPESISNMQLAGPEGWSMSAPAVDANGQVSFYFGSVAAYTMMPSDLLTLILDQVSADAGGGARSTRVQLAYANMAYTGDVTELTGAEEVTVNIVNHEGMKDIPLHVGFVGSNTLLNDNATANSLTIRITNVLPPDQFINTGSIRFSGGGDAPSTIIVRLEGREDSEVKDWAINTNSILLANVTASSSGPSQANPNWLPLAIGEGQSPFWGFYPETDFQLAPGQYIEISLAGIKAESPSSLSNIYVEYENLPGYWDGRFVMNVEKGPIVFRNGHMGLGTGNPAYPLSVGADTTGISAGPSAGGLSLVTGNTDRLSIDSNGNTTVNAGVLTLQASNAAQLNFANSGVNQMGALFLETGSTLSLGSWQNSLTPSGGITIMPSNHVSIGTTTDVAPLYIASSNTVGNTEANTGALLIGNNTGNHLAVDYRHIVAKINGTTPTTLYLGAPGSETNIEGSLRVPSEIANLQGGVSIQSRLTVSPGAMVTGIPIVEIQVATVNFSSTHSSPATQTADVSFSYPLTSATPVLQSWSMSLSSQDIEIESLEVNTDCEIHSSNTKNATVTVQIKFRDEGHDENFTATVVVAVIGIMNQAVSG